MQNCTSSRRLAGVGVSILSALAIMAMGSIFAGSAVAEDVSPAKQAPAVEPKITEAQAKEIALKALPGEVTKVEIERKLGKMVYVVEIQNEKQGEKDVWVDIMSGKVLAID